ncbi:hypothetical protein AVEN_226603-1 [Araneus ventricosus]|uniref:Uncharacterized protein n=1 Tax=Araneus ventricosus TaxID=182803 RepID=A0A4Y2U1C7_ARAVE|nr:hypothetical protein AVEN_226603-1 [Araneus ventricosus]
MEKQLKCVLMLSLKEMALRTVTVLLWNDSDTASVSKFRIPGFHTEESKKEWREIIEDKMKDKILKLELPESLTKQVIDIVRPIGLQIRRWKDCQEDYLSNKNKKITLPNSVKLFWNTAGMIDYRKTAEELIRCDALNVVQRYKIACTNCLEDCIPLLWEKLPEERKMRFLRAGIPSPKLELCWSYIIRGQLSELDYLLRTSKRTLTSFNQWAFERSVENGNKTATEYFFQKLTHEEREASLMRTVEALLRNRFRIKSKHLFRFRNEKLSDVSCYLLTLMTPEQQMEIFKKHPSGVLLRFLDWPWPDLFLENAGLIWIFLPPSGYGDLLLNMASRFELSDHYFPKLFQEFFMQSPLDCKKYFVDQKSVFGTPASRFLSTFFRCEDSESVEVIFRNMDTADRVRLLSSDDVLRLFYFYMLKDLWYMVEVCLREAALSREDMQRLKEAFIECNFIGQVEWENRKFIRFFEFLDEADASADEEKKAQKRKLENCCPE